jgi:hypothetical protein
MQVLDVNQRPKGEGGTQQYRVRQGGHSMITTMVVFWHLGERIESRKELYGLISRITMRI